MTFVISFYEVDRCYGGPEEGGWWYDTGQLIRTFAVAKDRDEARRISRRANHLLQHLQRRKTSVSSVIYSGGRHVAAVHENKAPDFFPAERPRYE